MAEAKASGCLAVAMDVDAAGLPFLKNMTPPAGSKSVAAVSYTHLDVYKRQSRFMSNARQCLGIQCGRCRHVNRLTFRFSMLYLV